MKFTGSLTQHTREILDARLTPALIGEAGIGKSSFVEALAYANGTRAFVLPCNQLADRADLTGARLVPYTKPDGTESYKQMFFPHDVIMEAVDYAETNPRENPILFLDEITRASSDITSAALTLETLRRIGHVKLPENLRIIVAGNDKGHITTLDDASLSRFVLIFVEPDAKTFIELSGDDLHPWIKTVLTAHPELIFCRKSADVVVASEDEDDDDDNKALALASVDEMLGDGDEMTQITTPRTITALNKWLQVVSADTLRQHLATPVTIGERTTSQFNELIEGFVGETEFATQLIARAADDLANSTATNGNQIVVPRPNCFDALLAATTVTQLVNLVGSLSDRERSGSLLFALSDATDHTKIIETLLEHTATLEREHMQTLMALLHKNKLNETNANVVMDSTTALAQSVSPMLGAYL